MAMIYQETTDLSGGKNLVQVPIYSMPDQKDGIAVFLLSGSYEYDLELIKRMPPPRTNYRNIIIPYSLAGKIGTANFKYGIPGSKYNERVQYLQKQKMVPQLIVSKPQFSKTSQTNVYIPISDVFRQLNQVIRGMSNDYIEQNVMNMMSQFIQLFPNTKKKIWVIDTNRFKIYDGENTDAIGSDLVNAVLMSAINGSKAKLSHDTTFIFRSGGMDYKMDLRSDMSSFGKTNPLKESHFDEFVDCYKGGNLEERTPTYSEENPNGRWRKYTIDEIMARDKTSLDITWMRGAATGEDYTLSELLEQIKEKSANISQAVAALEELIGEVDE